MKWQYVASLFLLLLSQVVFFFLMWYHTDANGYSWILYHQQDWIWSFVLVILAFFVFLFGLITDLEFENVEGSSQKKESYDEFS